MNYDWQEAQQIEAARARSDWWVIPLFLWPFCFFFKNLPATIPAVVVGPKVAQIIMKYMSISYSDTFYFPLTMIGSIVVMTAVFWILLRSIHTFALRLKSPIIRNIIICILLTYVFLLYSCPVYAIAEGINVDMQKINIIIGVISGMIGTTFYYNKIRHNLGSFIASEQFADAKKQHDKEIEEARRNGLL